MPEDKPKEIESAFNKLKNLKSISNTLIIKSRQALVFEMTNNHTWCTQL